jgi:hypothetical protein
VRILGLREFVQSLMKRQKAFLKPQNRNQLLSYSGETISLEASSVKLPNQEAVST